MFDFSCNQYYSDLRQIGTELLPEGKMSILVTGSTGLIGSCMVDALIYANEQLNGNIEIYALSRSRQRIQQRFGSFVEKAYFHIVEQDVQQPLDQLPPLDYMVGAASNADPGSYKKFPFETISANVLGTYHLIEYAKVHPKVKVLLLSTNEVYGAVEQSEYFKENEYGLIDYNVIRSGYPESKRVAELLIRSAVQQYGLQASIARLGLIYGPTMAATDNKVIAQFIRSILHRQNMVLKSEGKTRRTYCYVTDTVSGLFTVLFKGERGEAYNIANDDEIVSIHKLAEISAQLAGTNVIFNLPQNYHSLMQPKDNLLCTEMLRKLGWLPRYSIYNGLQTTVDILKEFYSAT